MSRTVWSSVMISTTFGFGCAARATSSVDDAAIVRAATAAVAIAPRAPTMRAITNPDTSRRLKLRLLPAMFLIGLIAARAGAGALAAAAHHRGMAVAAHRQGRPGRARTGIRHRRAEGEGVHRAGAAPARAAGGLLHRSRHARAVPRGRGALPARGAGPPAARLPRRALARHPPDRPAGAGPARAPRHLRAARASTAWSPTTWTATPTDTGFALTAADQLRFNRWIAHEAHARDMAVGLKNDTAQVKALVQRLRLRRGGAVLRVRRVPALLAVREGPQAGVRGRVPGAARALLRERAGGCASARSTSGSSWAGSGGPVRGDLVALGQAVVAAQLGLAGAALLVVGLGLDRRHLARAGRRRPARPS